MKMAIWHIATHFVVEDHKYLERSSSHGRDSNNNDFISIALFQVKNAQLR